MNRIQGKLAGLMLFIVFCAVAFAALRYPSPLVMGLSWTTALTLLFAAGVVGWVDNRDVFFKGVAVFGLGYALFAVLDRTNAPGKLLSTALLGLVEGFFSPVVQSSGFEVSVAGPGSFVVGSGPHTFTRTSPPIGYIWWGLPEFVSVGHAFFAIIHGVVGGLFAVWIKRRIDKKRGELLVETASIHE